jgi:hypothetical protein
MFVPLITPRHGPLRKHLLCCSLTVAAETCLPSRCIATAATRTIGITASNSSSVVARWFVAVGTPFVCGRYLVTGLHATVLLPTGVPLFLLFGGLCLWRLWLVSPSSPWLISHCDYSPTAPAAPFLRRLLPSCSLIRCQSVRVFHHRLPSVGAGKIS